MGDYILVIHTRSNFKDVLFIILWGFKQGAAGRKLCPIVFRFSQLVPNISPTFLVPPQNFILQWLRIFYFVQASQCQLNSPLTNTFYVILFDVYLSFFNLF